MRAGIVFWASVLIGLAAAAPVNGETIVGRVVIVDGDTLEIRNIRIRLNGIDAPESDQICWDESGDPYRCGAESAQFLSRFLARSRPTRCDAVGRDRYGRLVADCLRADGKSVAKVLVRAGYAMDWPRYSGGAYAADQTFAQGHNHGLWRGSFEMPWDYRAAKADEPPTKPTRSLGGPENGQCLIKGNVSGDGTRIYHMPGQAFYDRTLISVSKGERWFCSEAEARNAGWRRAKR